jgi:hypothetical protein
LAWFQALQAEGISAIEQIDRHPHQPQGGQAHRSRHAAHLAVSSLPQRDRQPGGGDRSPLADGWIPLGQGGVGQGLGFRRQGAATLDLQPAAEAFDYRAQDDAAVLDEMKQREARRVQQLADAKVAELELINEKLRLAAERRSEKEARQEAERAREAAAINAKISAASRPKGGGVGVSN